MGQSLAPKTQSASAPPATETAAPAAGPASPAGAKQGLIGNAAVAEEVSAAPPAQDETEALGDFASGDEVDAPFDIDTFLETDHGPVEQGPLGPKRRRKKPKNKPSKPNNGPTPAPTPVTPAPQGPTPAPAPAEDKAEDAKDAKDEAKEEGADFGIMRATNHRIGMTGAIIGKGASMHDVMSGPAADASASGKVPNGTPCTITEVGVTHVKVKYAVGDKNNEGWVNKALFSPQPDLPRKPGLQDVQESLTFQPTEGDQSTPSDAKGTDVQQGGLADCFLIAAMNAIGNANPKFLDDAVQYDAKTGLYKVRFYEESGWDAKTGKPSYKEHWETVDGNLPSSGPGMGPAYAEAAPGKAQWGAILEKAYAQWKGGYDAIGKGGNSGEAMEGITGVASVPKSTSALKADQVVPFFEQAQEKGLAVICGSQDSMQQAAQQPFSSAANKSGPYTGSLATNDPKQSIKQGTVKINDKKGKVGQAYDTGAYPDTKSDIKGGDVKSGSIDYKSKSLTLEYGGNKGPEDGKDLDVTFMYRGLIFPAKKVFAWHAYVFDKVVDGKIQLYNPWGSWQPDALTPDEFLTYYSNMNTNQVPQTADSKNNS
jgi:hypothetical protein